MGAVIFLLPAGQAPIVYTVQYSCDLGRPVFNLQCSLELIPVIIVINTNN